MNIYKKTDGSLVIANSPPPGGTLVTINVNDPLSTNAPLLRTLDSTAPTQFHPAIYYAGEPENSEGTVIKRSDGVETFRADPAGIIALLTRDTLASFGASYMTTVISEFDMMFLGCTTTEFSCTATSYTSGSVNITLTGTVTGTPAIGMPVYLNLPNTAANISTTFFDEKSSRCVIPRIVSIAGSVLTLSEPLLPSGLGSFTNAIRSNNLGVATVNSLIDTKLILASPTTMYPGEYIFGPGIAAGTFIVDGGTSNVFTVNKPHNLPNNCLAYGPIKGTGSVTKRIRLLFPTYRKDVLSIYAVGATVTMRSIGYTETIDKTTDSDFNNTDNFLSIFFDNATNMPASLGVKAPDPANATVPTDTSNSTNFPTTLVNLAFDSAGTLADIAGDIWGKSSLVELTNRTSTGTTAANTYTTYYSVKVTAEFNGLYNIVR